MGLEFLARVRRTSTWLGGVLSLVAATYVSPLGGLAFAAGAVWSLFNLQLIEKLVVTLTGEFRGTPEGSKRSGLILAGMLVLFAAGAMLLMVLSPPVLVAGFLFPFAVIVGKAVSRLLLGSRLWSALVTHRFRAAFAALALAGVAWFALGAITGAASAPAETGAHATPAAGSAGDEHALAAPAGGEHAEAGKKEGPAEFSNIVGVIVEANHGKPWAAFLEHYEVLVYSMFVALLLMLLGFLASRNAQMIPGGLQNAAEAIVELLSGFIGGILGPKHGPRFIPFLGTLFIYIMSMNLFGLIPFMHSPTASLNVTVALALIVFVYAQFIGFTELGPLGWADHMLGSPRDLTGWLLAPLMLPIHILGELAKPLSLSCRLFGNIFGEDMLLVGFASLGVAMLPFKALPFGVPMHAMFFPLALLGSALQAMVFTVLSTIYILLMLPHEHHDEHGHAEGAQHAH